jgi:putative transposase
VDQIVLSLSARGLTTGEISAHFAEVYGASVSPETVSKITDQVLEEMTAWMNRPLDEGRFPLIVANPAVKGFGWPGTQRTRCRLRSRVAISS